MAGRADRQMHVIELGGGEGNSQMGDLSGISEAGDFGSDVRGNHGDGGAGLEQQADLAGGILAAADNEDGAVAQDQEARKGLHGWLSQVGAHRWCDAIYLRSEARRVGKEWV